MTAAEIGAQPLTIPTRYRWFLWALIVALAVSGFVVDDSTKTYPPGFTLPFGSWVNAAMAWLTDDTPQIPNLPPIKDVTRAVAQVFDVGLDVLQGLLATGFGFTPGIDAPNLPPLPWFLVIGSMVAAGYKLGGRALAAVTLIGLSFIAVTGNWVSAMTTLASVLLATGISATVGLALGILAFKSKRVDRLLSPVLDVMQTVPVFAYLVPILTLVGFGPASALAATFIYAVPPMIRNVVLGLRRVPSELIELGEIAGCDPLQILARVMIPSALPTIMVGVNQAVMMTLNMVIIASMIGAGGLGFDVLTSLRRLDIGGGLEAGLAIVALAIILDRQSQAMARRSSDFRHSDVKTGLVRYRRVIFGIMICGLVYLVAARKPQLAYFPSDYVLTARVALNAGARWIAYNLSDFLDEIKTWFLIDVMVPVRLYVVGLPWFALPLVAALAGWRLGSVSLAAFCLVSLTAIFTAGLQDPALMTIYLCGLGTLISLLIGIPLGILGARSDRWHRVLGATCDTLQTLPSFVYLIPVVMLFRVGEFSALIAIVAYAIAPAIRYTDFGIRGVPRHLVEAGTMSGCSPLQTLVRIEIPLATPEMILGVSQTLMMALSMLVITALVGTRDLGQETYIALVKADPGRGLVAGIAVAVLAMVADRLLTAWSRRRFKQLGLS